MKRYSTILKISGYVLLGLAFFTLFFGIVRTWKNDNPFESFAAITIILIAAAFFCLSLSRKKELDEGKNTK